MMAIQRSLQVLQNKMGAATADEEFDRGELAVGRGQHMRDMDEMLAAMEELRNEHIHKTEQSKTQSDKKMSDLDKHYRSAVVVRLVNLRD